jgi:transcriptional regulator with XRE-family HTH domain
MLMSDTKTEVLPLKEWRLRRYWTYRHLAGKAGVSTFTIQRIEKGGRAQEITARKLADALGVSVAQVVEFTKD